MPSSTRDTGKSTPFMAPNTSSSSESRLTVIRCSPASARGAARARSADPLVVSVRSTLLSSVVRSGARVRISSGRSRRTSGSPPVMRSLWTPSPTKIEASRVISSNDSTCSLGRNAKSRPNTSAGMQYGQRKLQRSVTEIRRSRNARPKRSGRPGRPSKASAPAPGAASPFVADARARSSPRRGAGRGLIADPRGHGSRSPCSTRCGVSPRRATPRRATSPRPPSPRHLAAPPRVAQGHLASISGHLKATFVARRHGIGPVWASRSPDLEDT